MPDLVVHDLTMKFSGLVALDGISMRVKEGEIFSLIGPNGSGKSTLFNCINGFNRPQRGSVRFGETDVLALRSNNVVGTGISRTFQNLQYMPYMTVLDNVLLGAHHRIGVGNTVRRCVSRKQREAEEAGALEVMDFLGIANFEDRYLGGQPYGIRKLVEIARALAARPKMVLLDEPAAGMNDQETREIAKIVTEIRDELGITVFLVEHDMSLVMSISDRICVLDSGKVVAIGKPSEIREHSDVIRAFLGDEADA